MWLQAFDKPLSCGSSTAHFFSPYEPPTETGFLMKEPSLPLILYLLYILSLSDKVDAQFVAEVIEDLPGNVNFFSVLERDFDRYYGGVFSKLVYDNSVWLFLPRFDSLDLQIILLSFSGFSGRQTAYLTGISPQAARTRKSRIRRRILDSHSPRKLLYLQFLERKKNYR